MSQVVTKAYLYSDGIDRNVRTVAFNGFVEGYHECMSEETKDMDEWQRRLSEDYSNLKVKYWDMKVKIKALQQTLKDVKSGKLDPSQIDIGLLSGRNVKMKRIT